jgi:hypothetical protein
MRLEPPRHAEQGTGRKIFWSAVGGLALAVVLFVWRHFHWQHALIVGFAGGALVYSALRTVENLRRLHD